MTQEQGWNEADDHHDNPFGDLDGEEEYPRLDDTVELAVIGDAAYRLSASAALAGDADVHPVEVASRSLSEVMREAGYTPEAGDLGAQALLDVPFVYGENDAPAQVRTVRTVLSSHLRVVADGPYRGITFGAPGVAAQQAEDELRALLRAPEPEDEWVPVGSFGEFEEEYRRLSALFELTMNGPSRRILNETHMISRLSRALEIAARMNALHTRMMSAALPFGETRYVMVFVRKGSGLTADGSWLDVNFPGWRERLDRELWPGTHYVSPGESSTLCDLRAGRMAPDRWTDRFSETSCEACKARYLELFGPDEEDRG